MENFSFWNFWKLYSVPYHKPLIIYQKFQNLIFRRINNYQKFINEILCTKSYNRKINNSKFYMKSCTNIEHYIRQLTFLKIFLHALKNFYFSSNWYVIHFGPNSSTTFLAHFVILFHNVCSYGWASFINSNL